jgi:hypothetical protein
VHPYACIIARHEGSHITIEALCDLSPRIRACYAGQAWQPPRPPPPPPPATGCLVVIRIGQNFQKIRSSRASERGVAMTVAVRRVGAVTVPALRRGRSHLAAGGRCRRLGGEVACVALSGVVRLRLAVKGWVGQADSAYGLKGQSFGPSAGESPGWRRCFCVTVPPWFGRGDPLLQSGLYPPPLRVPHSRRGFGAASRLQRAVRRGWRRRTRRTRSR